MTPRPTLTTIRDACREHTETVALRLLPQLRRNGGWLVCKVPWREDTTASLGVSLTTGRWRDWGMPGDDGTMLDLVMRLDGCSLLEARDRLAGILGLTGDVVVRPRVKPPRVSCKTCRHCWHRYVAGVWPVSWRARRSGYAGPADMRYCTAVEMSDGEPAPTRLARRSGWACGKDGKMYEVRT